MNDYYHELCQDIINGRQRIGGEAGNLTVRSEGRSNKTVSLKMHFFPHCQFHTKHRMLERPIVPVDIVIFLFSSKVITSRRLGCSRVHTKAGVAGHCEEGAGAGPGDDRPHHVGGGRHHQAAGETSGQSEGGLLASGITK